MVRGSHQNRLDYLTIRVVKMTQIIVQATLKFQNLSLLVQSRFRLSWELVFLLFYLDEENRKISSNIEEASLPAGNFATL